MGANKSGKSGSSMLPIFTKVNYFSAKLVFLILKTQHPKSPNKSSAKVSNY
jgi:hypothetical protein